MSGFYEWRGEDLILAVRALPRASQDKFGEVLGERIKVHITAPPVNGKANKHLRRFLAKQFRVAATRIEILSGEGRREKRILIKAPAKWPGFIQKVTPSG